MCSKAFVVLNEAPERTRPRGGNHSSDSMRLDEPSLSGRNVLVYMYPAIALRRLECRGRSINNALFDSSTGSRTVFDTLVSLV